MVPAGDSAPAYDDVEVGTALPTRVFPVRRVDLVRYAGASGDFNPIHWNERFAKSVGLPDVIAHGMFTMAHMAAAVVAWAGHPSAVESLSAQFRAPVYLGDTIVAGGRVRAVDAEAGFAVLETWVSVERDGRVEWPVKKGSARVRLT